MHQEMSVKMIISDVQVKRRHARSLQKASDRCRGQGQIKGVPEKPSQSEILFFNISATRVLKLLSQNYYIFKNVVRFFMHKL